MIAVLLLLLLDNWIGVVIGVLYTLFIVIIWTFAILKTGAVQDEVLKDKEGLSWYLFVFNTGVAAVTVWILFNSPLDTTWMSIVTGLFIMVSVIGMIMHLKVMHSK
jgi:hypothetical protein